jgi:uncharacterized membrane protein
MRNFFGSLSLLFLGVWLGAIVFFIAVAQVAFSALPPLFTDHAAGTHAAGAVVGGAIVSLHSLGMVCGVLFLLLTIVRARFIHWHSYTLPALLVLAMLVLTAYSQFSIIPKMNTARDSIGGVVDAVPLSNPGRQIFEHLHEQSTRVESAVLICGLVAFMLGGGGQKPRQVVVL